MDAIDELIDAAQTFYDEARAIENGRSGRVQLSVYPSFCLKGLMHDE